MRTVSLAPAIEATLLELTIAIPEIYLDYAVDQIELVYDEVTVSWDITFVESDEVELVLGEVFVDDEFNAVFDLFDDETLVDEA